MEKWPESSKAPLITCAIKHLGVLLQRKRHLTKQHPRLLDQAARPTQLRGALSPVSSDVTFNMYHPNKFFY
jgi:hypothetical protein